MDLPKMNKTQSSPQRAWNVVSETEHTFVLEGEEPEAERQQIYLIVSRSGHFSINVSALSQYWDGNGFLGLSWGSQRRRPRCTILDPGEIGNFLIEKILRRRGTWSRRVKNISFSPSPWHLEYSNQRIQGWGQNQQALDIPHDLLCPCLCADVSPFAKGWGRSGGDMWSLSSSKISETAH